MRLNTSVAGITVDERKRRVTGVRLADGTWHPADYVVSNADVAFTYRNLIPEQYRRKYTNRKIDRMKYSMSLFVIYFGTKRQYRDQGLAHHNIILGPRYKGLLTDLFARKHLAGDFSLYLHMPSLTDPSVAPPGHETFTRCRPSRILSRAWTGRKPRGPIATRSCSSWRTTTCRTFRRIS